MPPIVARTGDSTYELRDASGNVIQTYNRPDMWLGVFLEDLIDYIANNVSGNNSAIKALTDVLLLLETGEWGPIEDER